MGKAGAGVIVVFALLGTVSLRATTPWTLRQSLAESTGAAFDDFGRSVSIGGNVLVVGAPQATPPGGKTAQGAAFLFVNSGGGWPSTPTAVLSEVRQSSQDSFGTSVAISPDGTTVVVGATDHSISSTQQDVGAAFVFVMPAGGWQTASSYTPTARLSASDGATGDSFGTSVAISSTYTVVVGATQAASGGPGAAYVFQVPKTGWKNTSHFTAKLTASNGAVGANLGTSVVIDGNTVVAGAPYASAGSSNTILCSQCGVAYVFEKGTQWMTTTETAQLYAKHGAADDQLGASVGISQTTVVDQTTGNNVKVGIVVAGAPGTGITDSGATNRLQGAAYVFVEPTSLTWTQHQTQTVELIAKDGAQFDELGFAVAVSGNLVIAGAPDKTVFASADQGEVYEFKFNPATGKCLQKQELSLGLSGAQNDRLGYSVSLYVSGGIPTALTGAPFHTVGLHTSQGAAYVWGP